MSLEAQGAERALISILFNNPEQFFAIDDVIAEADFVNTGSSMIFSLLKDIILMPERPDIDKHLIFAEAERKGLESFHHYTLNGELVDAISKMNVNPKNLGRYAADIKQASIKRALINKCGDLQKSISDYVGPSHELRNMVENGILDSLTNIDSGEKDMICLADDFEEVISAYADREGAIGIDVGLKRWQEDIGHIRNGAITGLFASTKVGKSQFSMWSMHQTAIRQRMPCLYLDTELQARQQQMRLCATISGIPFNIIESGKWKSNRTAITKIKEAFEVVKNAPIFYRNIAGMSVNGVIPTIRKFTYRQLGGPVVGDEPRGLVIYDYIKLMDQKDLSGNLQEYQLIGLLMSSLHDCAARLNIPIMCLGQLNAQGNIGIRRISENVDSATILRPKTPEELQEDGPARGNHVLEIKYSRNGPGHEYGEWINIFFDKSCAQFREDKRSSEVETVVAKMKKQAEEDTKKLSEVREW